MSEASINAPTGGESPIIDGTVQRSLSLESRMLDVRNDILARRAKWEADLKVYEKSAALCREAIAKCDEGEKEIDRLHGELCGSFFGTMLAIAKEMFPDIYPPPRPRQEGRAMGSTMPTPVRDVLAVPFTFDPTRCNHLGGAAVDCPHCLRHKLADADSENAHLRRLLACVYSGARLYRDDGELSDGSAHPSIDFKRDTPAQIENAIVDRNLALLPEGGWK